ncbi:MAG TPA: ABC transporter substrate-binding protein [Nocardioidaceae bacterium]|nr:ABC transporter substrate-binding protein [Nocardioidaceae bacterium]
MKLRKTWVMLAVSVFILTGCRGSDDDGGGGGEGDEGISAPGVTSEPCPDAVNQDNGCIYLGQISDLTAGPFAPLGVPITDAMKAFWQRVNDDGGISGYDIDASQYVRDNLYNPQTHAQVYGEIEGEVLALAQTLGSPTTLAILEDLKSDDMLAAPASWTSLWEFEDNIVESGAPYCFESMNVVDWAVQESDAKSVMAIGFPGDYGGDSAAGVEVAAEANGMDFQNIETGPGQEAQAGAISAVVKQNPDLVVLAVGPTETAVIVGQAAAQGYQGQFVGIGPTWNPALLQSPAAQALEALYLHSGPWANWSEDTPGHEAMRQALGDVQPSDGYTAGWVWSYPLKAALEEWLEGDYEKTRAGLVEAATSLETVDYEGMLPEEAGNFAGDPNEAAFRQTLLESVDPAAPTGMTKLVDFTEGPTAAEYELTGSCFGG